MRSSASGARRCSSFFAQAHYRSPVDYTDATLEQATADSGGPPRGAAQRAALRARRTAAAPTTPSDGGRDAAFRRFAAYMADDLDTPRALAELHGLARALNVAVGRGRGRPRRRGGGGRRAACARWTFSGSRRSTVAGRDLRRGAGTRRGARSTRAQQAISRVPTSCATRSQRSASQFATRRRARRSCPSMT